MDKINTASFTADYRDTNHIKIALSGRLDMTSTPSIWDQCLALQTKYLPGTLTINAKNVTYCDGAGIALLLELKERQTAHHKHYQLLDLKPEFENLITSTVTEPRESQASEEEHFFTENVGQFTVSVIQNIRNNIIFLGQLSYLLVQSLRHPKSVRWANMWFAMEDVGPKAFPIIALIGFLIGLISTFQSARPLGEFGAQLYIINLVGLGLVREMGPLMTAVLLAGRTASSFAAEIGTMKINQEVDALTTMGLNPVKYLTIPRVIATTVMTPILNVFLIIFGLIGCSIVMHTLGYPLQTFLNQLESSIKLSDILGGIAKATAFGLVIASVGCLHGLKTKTNASAVGDSTTQAVVSSLIMIVFVDGLFAIVYYTLRI